MIGTEGLLSGSSAVTDRMPSASSLRGTHVSNLEGGPLFLAQEKVLSTEPERRPLHGALFSDSAERASFYSLHRGPPLMLCTEGLLAGSTQRASSHTQQREPP